MNNFLPVSSLSFSLTTSLSHSTLYDTKIIEWFFLQCSMLNFRVSEIFKSIWNVHFVFFYALCVIFTWFISNFFVKENKISTGSVSKYVWNIYNYEKKQKIIEFDFCVQYNRPTFLLRPVSYHFTCNLEGFEMQKTWRDK